MTDRGFTLFDTADRPMRHRVGRSWRHRRAASRGTRGRDPRPAASAMSARARSSAAGRCAGRDRRHRFAPARRGDAISPQSRSTWMALPSFDRRVYEVARTIVPGATLLLRRDRGPARRPAPWRARWVKRSGATRSRSSCRATACSRPVARRAASPPTAGSRPSCACSRSNARARAMRLRCSTATARSASRCGRRRRNSR